MKDKSLLKTGIVGSAIAAVCCFTPALVLLLTAIGVTAGAVWLDYVLIPSFLFFVGLTGYAFIRVRRSRAL